MRVRAGMKGRKKTRGAKKGLSTIAYPTTLSGIPNENSVSRTKRAICTSRRWQSTVISLRQPIRSKSRCLCRHYMPQRRGLCPASSLSFCTGFPVVMRHRPCFGSTPDVRCLLRGVIVLPSLGFKLSSAMRLFGLDTAAALDIDVIHILQSGSMRHFWMRRQFRSSKIEWTDC